MRLGCRTHGLMCVLALSMCHASQAADVGFYVGLGIADSSYDVAPTDGIAVSINSPFGNGGIVFVPPESSEVDEGGVAWEATLGYRLHKFVAAEIAYLHWGEADVTETFRVPPFNPIFPGFVITQESQLKVKGPAISVLGILPLGAGWEIFVRGGVLFADSETELRFASGRDELTFGSEEWLAGLGIQWNLADRWALRAEYRRTDTLDSNFRSGDVDLEQFTLGASFAL